MDIAAYVEALRRPEIVLGFILAIASLALWQIPIIGWPLYPFYLFVVFVHEFSHALAALITGGNVHYVHVHPGPSGVVRREGGIGCIVRSAGYVGSALCGGLFIILAAGDAPSRTVLAWVGVILGILTVFLVRNAFGIIAGIGLATGLVIASIRLDEFVTEALLWMLAIQFVLFTFTTFGGLFDWMQLPYGRTDAHNLAADTGIPPLFWAILWSLIALLIFFTAISWAFNLPMPWELQFF